MFIILLVIVIFLIIIAMEFASEYAFKNAFLGHKKNKEDAFKVLKKRGMLDLKIYDDVVFESVNIKSEEGYLLKGSIIENAEKTNKYVILVHGYTANFHIHMPFVRMFLKLGFNILLIDARNHGESEGEYPSYGFYECDDLDRWIEFLVKRNSGREIIIGLHGQSMGGATVLLCGSRNDKVKFVIDDCGYTEGKEIIRYQFGKVKWVPFEPVYKILNWKVKRRVGFAFDEVSPRKELLKSKVPVLFIHGDEDTSVPVEMSINLYNERGNELDDLLIVVGAKHLTAYNIEKEKYEVSVQKFIDKCLK